MATTRNIYDLITLAKTSVDDYDFVELGNTNTKVTGKKLQVSSLFPSFATTGTGGENLYVNITNKNQLNFKGIKSGDTDLLTVATTSNNIVLTALEAGIDLSLCNNTTSEFLSGIDFTGTVTGECEVTNGGTGLSTIAKGAMLYASATDTIAATAAMSTNGQLLIGNATNGYPSVATLTAGTGMTITNGAGTITLAASHTNSEANIDMRNAAGDTTYNIDLHSGTGWISGTGTDEGITVDGDGKTFLGEDTPTAFFDDILNIKGGIRFANDSAPTIKPNATASSAAGMATTIEGGASANGASGNLNLNGGTASGSGDGGSVIVTAGKSTSGTDGDIQLKTYTSSTATAGLTIAAEGQDVTVNTGSLVITSATEGIIHTNSGTVTQATDHTNGVTINASSGIITLAAVALANATNAEFTVTNSYAKTSSVILVSMQDENTTNNAQLSCATHTHANGSFKISVHHADSVGSTSTTASKIHFLIINPS